MLLLSLVTGGTMWVTAYVLNIVRGLRRATYGLPLVPVCFNIGFDFTYAFLVDAHLLAGVPAPFADPEVVNTLTH
jgi:hypothetical protein